MVKGTTPTIIFRLPVARDSITFAEAFILQSGNDMICIEEERMTFDDTTVSFKLEDWETMSFVPGINAEVQLTVATSDGSILVSDIKKIPVRKKYPEDAV